MKPELIYILLFAICILKVYGQENAAPSMHLSHNFSASDAILKMQKIKIVQSANASFFEINWFTNGYAGLQQTPDNSYGKSNILLSSLWDANTAGGVYSIVEYYDEATFTSRFGGEGDGWKTINPYNWSINTWYNLVNRAWVANNRLFIATFIKDLSTNNWLHTATLSIPFTGVYLASYNNAFLENWDGTNSQWNGSFVRKAFFKDSWKLNAKGNWEKNTNATVSVNNSQADIQRNGIYHDSFNAGYDENENAYFMQHGGSTTLSGNFNGGRTLNLPAQTNQGTIPSLTIGTILSVEFAHNPNNNSSNIGWLIDNTKSPQLSYKVEILNEFNAVILTVQDTKPQQRNHSFTLTPGNYQARITIVDIFNQNSTPVSLGFNVPGNYLLVSQNSLSVSHTDESTISFDIASNTNWDVTSNQTWLTSNSKSGSNNAIIILTTEANTNTTNRTAIVKVTGPNVTEQTIMVTQDASIVTGINSIHDQEFKFYPNPSRTILYFENTTSECQAIIYDLTGRVVLSERIQNNQLHISDLSLGTYIIQIITNSGIIKRRLVKS